MTGSPADGQPDGRQAQLTNLSERDYVLALLQRFQAPPDIGDIAICLLLGRALQTCGWSAAQFFALLRRPGPLLVIRTDIDGFVTDLLRLIESRRFIDRTIRVTRMINKSPIKARRVHYNSEQMILDYGISTITPDCSGKLASFGIDLIGEAMARGETVLAFLDSDEELPPALQAATDLTLEIGDLDVPFLSQLMQLREELDREPGLNGPDLLGQLTAPSVKGEHAKSNKSQKSKNSKNPRGRPTVLLPDLRLTSIQGLRLALRGGRSHSQWIKALKAQAAAEQSDDDHHPRDEERRQTTASPDRLPNIAHSIKHSVSISPVSATEIIQPEVIPEPSTNAGTSETDKLSARLIPTIETLAGYGKAKDWALALKADLALWQAGSLAWSTMSPDLLLSGPPGTGKTSFARALCNSLQLPLLPSSVAHWLQAGHLGDVLRCIDSLFEDARAHAPCILFIDELDGISTRNSGKSSNDAYSNNVINRLLIALDGLNKSDGVVIIGATNRPENIDPALLRSGRLETHITIAKPDTDALQAILAHHLGADLPNIIATAPQQASKQSKPPYSTTPDQQDDAETQA